MGGGGEGGCCTHPYNPYWKWYQTIPLYTHSLNFSWKMFSFAGSRPEKGIKIWPFLKNFKPKSLFLNIIHKIPSKINSTHPIQFKNFNFQFKVVLGNADVPKMYKNINCHRKCMVCMKGIRNKKFGKAKNFLFQVKGKKLRS